MPKLSIKDRLANLNQFREVWIEFGNFVSGIAESGYPTQSDEATYQSYVMRVAKLLPRVQVDLLRHAPMVTKSVPAGGGYYRNVMGYIPFTNIAAAFPSLSSIFQFPGSHLLREFYDDLSLGDRMLLHAIGTLEFALELGGEELLPVKEDAGEILVDVLSAIRRALRPAFREPPSCEKDVQDQLEVILRAQGVRFEREAQMEHATKKVKPDFVLPGLHTALEVKLCASSRREKEIIEEIGADIVAYRKQYPALVFIVYEVATIADKEAFKEGFRNESGVLIEIIS